MRGVNMTIYVDPRLIGRANYESIKSQFPQIDFVTEVNNKEEIEVLITMPKVVKEMNLSDYPKLKWIQYLMAGYDGVDLKKLNEHNIIFSNAQDIFSKSIAEDVFAKIFYFNRNIRYYIDSKKNKVWEPIPKETELTNQTALILGVGSIGKELAKRMKGFEMNVIGYRKNQISELHFDKIITMEKDLENALQIADYVIMALPLTDETTHMFNKRKFAFMKSSAIFINVGRGKTINQDDLILTLKEGRIRGAALDVTDPEPLPQDSELWTLEQVFLTPHNASSSPYMRERLYQMILMNLTLYLDGKSVKYQIKK